MKKNKLFLVLFIYSGLVQSQVLYDNSPIDLDGSRSFAVSEKVWDHNSISFFFQNGTDDIANNEERNAFYDAFDLWSCSTQLTFFETSNFNADIIIRWAEGDHGDPCNGDDCIFDGVGGVLAHAFSPPPNGGSFAGDAHFDDEEAWTLSIRNSSLQPIDLQTVVAHEIGHSIGLLHSSDIDALMYPFYFGSHRYLGCDDIEGIQSLYGFNTCTTTTGPTLLCSSDQGTYTLSNVPTGAGVSWSTSPNLSIMSGQGTSTANVRASSSNDELGWVQATITGDCGEVVLEQKNVSIKSIPSANNISMRSVGSYQLYTDRWTNITGYYDGLSRQSLFWEWRVSNSSVRYTEGEFYINVKPNVNFDTEIYIAARVCNECGCSGWAGEWFDVRYRSSSGGGGKIIEY